MPKGIDDLLAAGGIPTRLRGTAVENFFNEMRTKRQPETLAVPLLNESPIIIPRVVQRSAFPIDIFPESVTSFISEVAVSMGCPVDFPGVSVLTVASAAIGAARAIRVKRGWEEFPGLYTVIVATPGQAKTPALKAIMNPLYEEQDQLYTQHKSAMTQFNADLQAAKASDADPETLATIEEPPPMRSLFVADTTIEALAVTLEQNQKGVLLFRDELSAWVGSMDQYRKGADRQFFLSAWSCEMARVDRKSSKTGPTILPHPFISVLGGIQPDMLSTLETKGNHEDGFLQRLLFAYPPEQSFQGWNDSEIGEESSRAWRCIVLRLLDLQQDLDESASEQPLVLEFSAEGRQAFIDFINRLAAEMNAEDFPLRIVGACAKLRSYCARFALILHLLRWAASGGDEGTIDALDVAGAVRLCEYFKQQAMVVYQCLRQSSEEQSVEVLVAWIRRRHLLHCTARDVVRAGLPGITKSSDAQELLAAAVDYGYGEWEPPSGNSKHHRFVLNSVMAIAPENTVPPSI